MWRGAAEFLIFCSFLAVFFISSSSYVTLGIPFFLLLPLSAHVIPHVPANRFRSNWVGSTTQPAPACIKIPQSILKCCCFIYLFFCRESFAWCNSWSRFAHCLFGFGVVFSLTPCVAETPPVEQSKNWVRASEYQKRSLIIISVYCQASFFCQIKKKKKRKTLQTKGWHI